MTSLLLQGIEFALPCWIANMAFTFIVPLKRLFPFLARIDRPLDGGRKLGGARIFGSARNMMGLMVACILALVWGFLAHSWLGACEILLTFVGAVMGSFVKRRLHVPQGNACLVIDQGDYMLVVGVVFYICGLVSFAVALVAFVITLIAHPLVSYIGYVFHIKEKPY